MDKGRRGGGSSGDADRPPRRGFRGTAENSKTKICMRWQNGECRFGDRCNFAHGDDELRSLPPRSEGAPSSGGGGGRGRGRGRGGPDSYREDYRSPRGADGNAAGGPGAAPGSRGFPYDLYSEPSGGREHAKWVASGCPINGHGGWTQYTSEKGEKYYHNKNTNITQWDAPAEWKGPV